MDEELNEFTEGGTGEAAPEQREQTPDELLAELRALGRPRRGQQDVAPAAPEVPPVGQSQLAQDLQSSGFIDQLGRQFAQRRQDEDRQAIEQSQGWSTSGITSAVSDFFARSRERFQEGVAAPLSGEGWQHGILGGLGRDVSPERAQELAEQEAATASWMAPFSRSVADATAVSPGVSGPGLQFGANVGQFVHGIIGSYANRQDQRLLRAQAMLRGEVPLPETEQWRALVDTGARTITDMFTSLPIRMAGIILGYGQGAAQGQFTDVYGIPLPTFQDNQLRQFGESVKRVVEQAFPNDPARQFEFSQTLVQGLASTMAFGGQAAVGHLLGAGPRGQLALIALSGMAAQVPDEFQRVTEAMNRGNATERDRIIAVLANSALGATEAAPFAGTLTSGARGLPAHLAQGFHQGREEIVQEFTQQVGQNLTRRLTYDPSQDPYEGVGEAMVVAAISGMGFGTAFSGMQGAAPPPAPAAPEDASVIQARSGGARTGPATPAPAPSPATPPAGTPEAAPPPAATVAPTPEVGPDDQFGLNQRFPPPPEEQPAPTPGEAAGAGEATQGVQPPPAAEATPAPQEEPALDPEEILGNIRAMADRVLPNEREVSALAMRATADQVEQYDPDLARRLREIADAAEAADTSGVGDVARRFAPDPEASGVVAAPAEPAAATEGAAPTGSLAQRLAEVAPQQEETAQRTADLELIVGQRLPELYAEMEDVRARNNISTPLNDTEVHAVARRMVRDNLTAEEALERHDIEQYEAHRQRLGQPESVGSQGQRATGQAAAPSAAAATPAAAPTAAPSDARGQRPAGAGPANVGAERARPSAASRNEPGGRAQASVREQSATDPTPQQRQRFRNVLFSKRPIKWTERSALAASLKTTEEQLEKLITEAAKEGLVRINRDGDPRRNPARIAAVVEVEAYLGRQGSLPMKPSERIERAIDIRQTQTNKEVSGYTARHAMRLMLQMGQPGFDLALRQVKTDPNLRAADIGDLAHIVGDGRKLRLWPTKPQAFAAIEQRHKDNKAFLERAAAAATLASYAPGESTSRQARELETDVRNFEQSLWEAGKTGDEIAEAINERYRNVFEPVTGAQIAERRVWWDVEQGDGQTSYALEYDPERIENAADPDAIAAPTDIDARPATPQVLEPMARQPVAPLQTNITPQLRQEILSLYDKGKGANVAEIAAQLTQEAGAYVGPTEVANVIEDAGLFSRGFARNKAKKSRAPREPRTTAVSAEVLARMLDPEFGAQPLQQQAAALAGELAEQDDPAGFLADVRYRLRQQGRAVPTIARPEAAPREPAPKAPPVYSNAAFERILDPQFAARPLAEQVAELQAEPFSLDINEAALAAKRQRLRQDGYEIADTPRVSKDKFVWTDESIAKLTSPEIAGLSDADKAAIIDPSGRLTENAIRLKRRKLRQGGFNLASYAPSSSLDMSPEARKARAEAMGFDTSTVWHHGSASPTPFESFDLGRAGSGAGDNSLGIGVYFTSHKSTMYSMNLQTGQPGHSREYFVRVHKPFVWDQSTPAAEKESNKRVKEIFPAFWTHGDLGVMPQQERAWTEALKQHGYDAVQSVSFGRVSELVVLDPSNIRSVNATFDPAQEGSSILLASYAPSNGEGQSQRRDLDRLGFFSAALEAAKSWKQTKGTPEQVIAHLKASGVKDAEIEAVRLREFLGKPEGTPTSQNSGRTALQPEGQSAAPSPVSKATAPSSVSKSSIIEFLERNRVEVREAVYATPTPEQTTQRSTGQSVAQRFVGQERALTDLGLAGTPKWSQYSLDPSNPTYRETVIHLPSSLERTGGNRATEAARLQREIDAAEAAGNWDLAEQLGVQMDTLEGLNDVTGGSDTTVIGPADFAQGHYPEPNVIAHARTSLQRDAQGKSVFLIDELQSDWGQKLRDGGVRDEAKIQELEKRIAEIEKEKPDTAGFRRPWDAPGYEAWLGRHSIVAAELATAKAVAPGHPLVNTTDQWTTTALRRLITQAVEAGAERIAISPGAVQNSRPGISQVQRVGALRYVPSAKTVQSQPVGGGRWERVRGAEGDTVTPEQLAGLTSKELAAQLLAAKPVPIEGGHTAHVLEFPKGVEIGGHGMIATYDGIYPRNLHKLLRKMDSSIKQEEIPLNSSLDGRTFDQRTSLQQRADAALPASGRAEQPPILFHTFPLTDKVKAQVQEGLALFALSNQRSRLGPEEGQQLRQYTPAFAASLPQVVGEIEGWMRRMLPADIAIRLMDRITSGPYNLAATYTFLESQRRIFDQAIEVALTADNGRAIPMRTTLVKAFHEIGHALREYGRVPGDIHGALFTDKEWQILVERANKIGVEKHITMVMDGKRIPAMPTYRRMYEQQLKNAGYRGDQLYQRLEELLDQERVNNLAEQWATGTSFGTKVDSLLERIVKFFEAIKNALNGLGFQTHDDVFQRWVSGEIAQRAGRQEPTFEAFPYTPTPAQAHLSSPEGRAALDALMGSSSPTALMAIAGPKAKTAPQSSRNLAESMLRKGKDADAVFKQTGWFLGPDNMWRFEIDDSAAKIVNLDTHLKAPQNTLFRSMLGKQPKGLPKWASRNVRTATNVKLPDILSHSKLYEAYPFLRDMRTSIIVGEGVPKAKEGGALVFREGNGRITYSPIMVRARKDSEILPTLMHEIQHYIQRKEGFAAGSVASKRPDLVLDKKHNPPRLDFTQETDKPITYGGMVFSPDTVRNAATQNRAHMIPMTKAEETALRLANLYELRERNDRQIYDGAPGEPHSLEWTIARAQMELVNLLKVTEADYVASLGEQEANLVMDRLGYTAEQRRKIIPRPSEGQASRGVGPDFRVAADEIYRRAQFAKRMRKERGKKIDLAPGIQGSWYEHATRDRDLTQFYVYADFHRRQEGRTLHVSVNPDTHYAIIQFGELGRKDIGEEDGPKKPIADARLNEIVDATEKYLRSLNLFPTGDIRLLPGYSPEFKPITGTSGLNDAEFAFWRARDPMFMMDDPRAAAPQGGTEVLEIPTPAPIPADLQAAGLDPELWKIRQGEHEVAASQAMADIIGQAGTPADRQNIQRIKRAMETGEISNREGVMEALAWARGEEKSLHDLADDWASTVARRWSSMVRKLENLAASLDRGGTTLASLASFAPTPESRPFSIPGFNGSVAEKVKESGERIRTYSVYQGGLAEASGTDVSSLEPAVTPVTAETIDGRSARVYHGTHSEYDPAQMAFNRGIARAIFAAQERDFSRGFGTNIIELQVQPGNYFDFRNPAHVKQALAAKPFSGPDISPVFVKVQENNVRKGQWSAIENGPFRAWLEQNGFDGAWLAHTYDTKKADRLSDNIVVWTPGKLTNAAAGSAVSTRTPDASIGTSPRAGSAAAVPRPPKSEFSGASFSDLLGAAHDAGAENVPVPGWRDADVFMGALSELEMRRLRSLPEKEKIARIDEVLGALAKDRIYVEAVNDDFRWMKYEGGQFVPAGEIVPDAISDRLMALQFDSKGNRTLPVAKLNALFDGHWVREFSSANAAAGSNAATRGPDASAIIASEQPDGSWEISFFKANEDQVRHVSAMISAIQQDIGSPLSPKGWLTPEGYRYWQSISPEKVKYHKDAGPLFGGMYASPRAVEFAEAILNEVTAYHGTSAEIVGGLQPVSRGDLTPFDPSRRRIPAISLATAPEQANKFTLDIAGRTAAGSSVRRVSLNAAGFREVNWPEFMREVEPRMDANRWHPRAWQTLLEQLQDSGTPGALVRGMSDAGGSAPQYVVLDASRISNAAAGSDASARLSEASAHLSKLKSSLPPEAFMEARREERYSFASGSPSLDMSLPARMARAEAMGFDTSKVLYHGNPNGEFSAFDTSRLGATNASGVVAEGVHFTTDEFEARAYAGFYARLNDPQRPPDRGHVGAYYIRLHNPLVITASSGWRTTSERLAPELKFDESGALDWSNRTQANVALFTQRLKDAGYDGVIVDNMPYREETIVFDPSNIRSVNAAFDPAQEGSPLLLAAYAPNSNMAPNSRDFDGKTEREIGEWIKQDFGFKDVLGFDEDIVGQVHDNPDVPGGKIDLRFAKQAYETLDGITQVVGLPRGALGGGNRITLDMRDYSTRRDPLGRLLVGGQFAITGPIAALQVAAGDPVSAITTLIGGAFLAGTAARVFAGSGSSNAKTIDIKTHGAHNPQVLAHELFHALIDHGLAGFAAPTEVDAKGAKSAREVREAFDRAKPYMISGGRNIGARPDAFETMRPALRDAWVALERAVYGTSIEKIGQFRALEREAKDIVHAQKHPQKLSESLSFGLGKTAKDRRARLKQVRAEAKTLDAEIKSEITSFYRSALDWRSGDMAAYEAQPTEMLARSFETYIYDKAKERGLLTPGIREIETSEQELRRHFPEEFRGLSAEEAAAKVREFEEVSTSNYPQSEDRARINAAWDNFFQTLSVREDAEGRLTLAAYAPNAPAGSGGATGGAGASANPSLSPSPQSRNVRSLSDIISDLKETLGLTVTQGLYGMTVRDQAGGRTWRFRPQRNLRAQYDTVSGVARTRITSDIDAIAHEGGHHLERLFGAELEAFKQANADELGTTPVPDAPLPIPLNPTGYSGMEIDAETQAVMIEAATAMRQRQQIRAGKPSRSAAYEAEAKAAIPNRTVERRLGKAVGNALVTDLMQRMGTANFDAVQYLRQRYSFTGNPSPRQQPAPSALALSEGFAEFFARYITDPDGVRGDLPGTYTAFEEFLDANDPAMLEGLEKVQLEVLSADYKAYRAASSMERRKADQASYADKSLIKQAVDWFRSLRRGTARQSVAAAIADMQDGTSGIASTIYQAGIDEGHPHYMAVKRLLEVADSNKIVGADGRAISLAVHENPYKLMRSVADAFKTGLRWIQDGMPSYRHGGAGFEVVLPNGRVLGVRPTMASAQALAATSTEQSTITPLIGRRSKSLHDALGLAMNGKWSTQGYENFGDYLVARRAVEEWTRFASGQLERPPIKSYVDGQPATEIAALVADIQKYEAANPGFSQAAQMVYDFLWQQAIHDFHSGRLSQAELDYRATRKHFYVPFSRDMRDILSVRGFGGRSQKFAKDKRFKGSDRAIINPLEAIIDQTFHKAAATHFNDVMKAYAELSTKVGAGGGAIVERVTKTEEREASNAAFRELEINLQGLGYSAEDAREMVKRVESDFGDTQLLIQYAPQSMGPVRPLLVPLWENGERTFLRVNDPDWAAGIYESLNGIGREMSNLFMDVVAKPAALLRWGVTTNPGFWGANVVRDMWSAWILTGSITNPKSWPVVTQMRGLYHELTQSDMAKLYQEVAGLMGGQNVAALSKVRDKADAMALQHKGLQIRPIQLGVGVAAGAATGFALGGPVGAWFGGFAGAGLHRGVRNAVDTIAQFSDMTETATRLGVFTEAYKAALIYNPSLTPYQAAQEAAFAARDLIDFGRRGSKMLATARVITFLNANVQGLDAATRRLLARSDRGMALSTFKLTKLMAAGATAGFVAGGPVGGAVGTFLVPALATNAAARSAAARALLAPYTKKDMGIPISKDEERALAQSAKAWANLLVYTLALIAAGAFYQWWGDDDDGTTTREYRDIDARFRFRNQPFKVGNQWFSFPRAFEWAVPSIVLEAAIESQFANDPRFWQRVREGLFDVLSPPGVPQAARIWRDVGANYDSQRQRPIVNENYRHLPPELQFNANASQFALQLSAAVNGSPWARTAVERAGSAMFATNFELTPAIIDYVLRAGLGYWGRDIQKASNVTTLGGARVTDYPLVGTAVQRFVLDPNRMSAATAAYWQMMGREHEGYRRAAGGYREYNSNYGPAQANQYLATLADPEQRAYALLMNSGTPQQRRQHPINRLDGIVHATMDLERDISLQRLANTSSPTSPTPIILPPARLAQVRDALAAIRAVEAHNSMVVLGHQQFAGRPILPIQPALDMLNAASPEVLAEYQVRLTRRHVSDFASVASAWPDQRATLLREWQEAVDRDAALIRRSSRSRAPVRLPIGSSRYQEEAVPAP